MTNAYEKQAQKRSWYHRHKDEVREKSKISRSTPESKEKARQYKKRYFQNPDNVARAYLRQLKYKAAHREEISAKRRIYMQKIRKEVIDYYGGKCACCGESEIKFLGMDHINGKGKHDTKKREHGQAWYMYLRKEKPTYLQVLCHNCNLSKGFYGACPHEKNRNNTREISNA